MMGNSIGLQPAARLMTVSTLVAVAIVLTGASGVASAAMPAWKLIAETGPTYLPPKQSEIQQLGIEATGGVFTVEVQTAQGSGQLSAGLGIFELTAGSPEATYIAGQEAKAGMQVTSGAGLPVGATVIAVSGTTVTFSEAAETTGPAFLTVASKEVASVTTSLGDFHEGDVVTGEHIPTGTTVTGIAGETITLSQFPEAGGAVALRATETTDPPIPFDAAATTLEKALNGLPVADVPNTFRVMDGPGGDLGTPYTIAFGGPFADENVAELGVDAGALSGEHHSAHVFTSLPGGPGTGEIAINPANVGGAPSLGEYVLTIGPLPAGITATGPARGVGWTCSEGAIITCHSSEVVQALHAASNVSLPVEVVSSVDGRAEMAVAMTGGGSRTATYHLPIVVSGQEVPPGVAAFWAGTFDENGQTYAQAGGHANSASSYFLLNTMRSASGRINPVGDSREEVVDLPAGFVGDPMVTQRCPQSVLVPSLGQDTSKCNEEMNLGVLTPFTSELFGMSAATAQTPLYNDVPVSGAAAQFTTKIGFPLQSLLGAVRSSEEFGITISAPNNPTVVRLYGAFVALRGFPAAAHGKAFLRNPTDCVETARRAPISRVKVDTWQETGKFSPWSTEVLPAVAGCAALTEAWVGNGPDPQSEEPSFSFEPSTTQASSPAGATATLHIPQAGLTDPSRLATSDLKKTVVTLPKGLNVNPSSAAGLQSCTEAEVGYEGPGDLPNPTRFNEEPVTCPDASKLGTFTISTPLLEEGVEGTIYLAAQEENPFNSLIALYLVVENARFGLNLKLPGEVSPDPVTGQLTATFDNNPQLPFEDLTLHFRGGGGRSTLATPETCGHFETTGSLEPWSAEHGEALPIHETGFSTSGPCAGSEGSRPFAPTLEAGTTGTQAGSYSPLVIKVNRQDGEQELRSLDFTLPKGLTGKLAGIPYCSDSAIKEAESKSGKVEQAAASCPAASRIGSVDTSAGVGNEPIHVGGSVYLAGPYKGAPLSSVVVTPAVAGPFDLGDVVVRAPLFVNPETAEITAKSDPIPTILRGIPLKVRSVSIYLDRGDFTLNPTSCEPMMVTASIMGSSGATASPSNRFQVGGCNKLKFKPKLKISLKGSTKHGGLPALKAVVTYPKKGAYANIRRAQVNLPHSEFLEQDNLNKTCTRPVLLEGKCPKTTIYGKAKAWTPLLEKPLQGPVYLVGGYGYKLPALVAELNGQIRVVLKGKVDSGRNKGIRNTFEAVPDAPVSRFVLEMKGGRKYGLLINSENLCRKPQRGLVRFTAQNGKVDQYKPLIANQCGKGKKKTGKKKR